MQTDWKYNITILHGEEEQEILMCSEVSFCIAVTQSDHFWVFEKNPVDYLFSNQFMEDSGRIYSLRKYFPSFDDWNV